MNPGCWLCKHYDQKFRIVTTGVKNVSGELAKFIRWDKHRCVLKQEDRYPNHCDFEMNEKLWEELERKYPDLALCNRRYKELEEELKEKVRG